MYALPLLYRLNAISRLAVILSISSAWLVHAQNFEVIAITGDGPPETNGTFEFFNTPTMNNSGQIVFRSDLMGTSGGAADDVGIYRSTGSGIVTIAREGATIPGGDTTGQLFGSGCINDSSEVAFNTLLGSGEYAILLNDGAGSFAKIVEGGTAAPDANGTFANFGAPALNDNGLVAFIGELNNTADMGGADYQGIFTSSGGAVTQIARTNSAPPDGNGTYVFLNDPVLNDAGQIGFYADLGGTSGGGNDNSALYRSNGTMTTKLVREGDSAPGADGGTFSSFGFPSMNEAGVLAFTAGVSGATSDSKWGVFTADGTTVNDVVRRSEAAPDGNGTMGTFDEPIINDSGEVAFLGFTSGSSGGNNDNAGVFLHDGSLIQVAREANSAGGNGVFAAFDDLSLNDSGQVAFYAELRSTSGGTADDRAIYFFDNSSSKLTKVLREGDSFLGSTVVSLGLMGFDYPSNQTEECSGFGDTGQVAFEFVLADSREGVAVWTKTDVTPPDNSALRAALTKKLKKLKKALKKAKQSRKVSKIKKLKKQIKKLKVQIRSL